MHSLLRKACDSLDLGIKEWSQRVVKIYVIFSPTKTFLKNDLKKYEEIIQTLYKSQPSSKIIQDTFPETKPLKNDGFFVDDPASFGGKRQNFRGPKRLLLYRAPVKIEYPKPCVAKVGFRFRRHSKAPPVHPPSRHCLDLDLSFPAEKIKKQNKPTKSLERIAFFQPFAFWLGGDF